MHKNYVKQTFPCNSFFLFLLIYSLYFNTFSNIAYLSRRQTQYCARKTLHYWAFKRVLASGPEHTQSMISFCQVKVLILKN